MYHHLLLVHEGSRCMLALTRRVGEEIVLGDPRKPVGVIRVVEIHGDKVRLSFDFPKDMQINRKELAELKARQNASDSPAPSNPSTSSKADPPLPDKPSSPDESK